MANEPNLKVNVGADTSQFTKGMKTAKAELRDFAKVSDNALGSIGNMLGVDTGKVEQFASAIRGMGRQLSEAGSTGAKALGSLLSSVSTLGVGIAALGISGAVASFKALNSEAEAFKNTVAGANLEMQTAAYIETYQQVFHDFNKETGQSVAEFESKWKKTFAVLAANFKQNFVGILTGKQLIPSSLPNMFLTGNAQQMGAALGAAGRAEQISEELYKLDRQRSDLTREIADLDARIAANKEKMRDATVSLVERLAAYDQIVADINTKESLLVPIEKRRTELMDEMVSLTASSPAAVDAANQQYVRQQSLVKSLTDEKAAQLRYVNGFRSQAEKQTAEMEKQLELQKQIAQSRADLAALDLSVSSSPFAMATTSMGGGIIPQNINTTALQEQLNASLGGKLFAQVEIQIDKGSLLDMSRQVESVVSSLAVSLGDAIGGLVGDLVTGGSAWENFSNAALSAFGDMATAVGKIAIEAGIATLGIKAALETLGPGGAALAIAAGTALVALGAAVKAGLSNVASGNYGASANVASGAYSYGSGDYETRELTVKVEGTLKADGDSLVTVLNNTNKKNGYTT